MKLAITLLLPLVYLSGVILTAFYPGRVGFGYGWLAITGLTLAISGFLLALIGILTLGNFFGVLPKPKRLITHGVYRYLRHPIYLGLSLGLIGLSLATGSTLGFFYTLTVIIPLNLIRARAEEKKLLQIFGAAYLAYQRETFF